MELLENVNALAQYWANDGIFDESTRSEISGLIDKGDEHELVERFYRDLEFGTGGLRGIIGAGSYRMNRYNVRKAAYALASYARKAFPHEHIRVAVSFDSRNYSKEFARECCRVFAAMGIKTYVTRELRPVPMLSYMVKHFECHAGVCITASHNPPEYNGFKAYWQTGGQLVPPHDKGVIDIYSTIKSYDEIPLVDFDSGVNNGLIEEVADDFDQSYFDQVATLRMRDVGKDQLKILYTPIHGSGYLPVKTCLQRFGFKDVHILQSQAEPDGRFPTVSSPNPESEEALALAVEEAKKLQADIVLGTDPDCDRVGVVVRHKGSYQFLNGNQLGSLLVDYVLGSWQEAGKLPSNPLVVKTIVTTDLQSKISEFYGARCDETLTGFKWICQLIEDYESGKLGEPFHYVCGGEESYGFLADQFVRDKDGVITCCIASEMAAFYKSQGKTLLDALDDLFLRHGCYHETLTTLTLAGKSGSEKISSMMSMFRDHPPQEIALTKVEKIKDFQSKKEVFFGSGGRKEQETITLPRSNVLQFYLADGSKISVRPSGTEPKIKFYVSVNRPVKSASDLDRTKQECVAHAKKLTEGFVSLANS